MKKIDPNQYLIYTPQPSMTRKSGKSKSRGTEKKGLNPSVMNENLKAMKGFYGDKEDFTTLQNEDQASKKSGENLSGGLSSSRRVEGKSLRDRINAKALKKKSSSGLKEGCSTSEMVLLRSKTKEDYGEGLVSTFHKDARTVEEHEAAQLKAYEALDEKIKSGVVKPEVITSEMLNVFELKDKPVPKIESTDQISGHIASELRELRDKGFIKKDEEKRIQAEAEKFTQLYTQAFPDAKPREVFELVRDNSRKLAYQTERDKYVFSGSSHGTTHILEGNMRMADRMLESLGDRATAKDKVLIHQIIVDHDIGYTAGIAQAKGAFEASKDHPLFSTSYVEANKEYYIEKFGTDGYEMIKKGILQHSYPVSDYNTPTDPEKGFNPGLIRSITSTVDALGVTAEIKCPAFFREPEVIKVLQKVQLYSDTHDGKVSPEAMAMYTEELKKIADKETDEDRKKGFQEAIKNHFNERVPEFILGQYTGVLNDITLTERNGKIVPSIKMDISQSQALLQDLFGDKMATKAFTKAMDDFGVSKEKMSDMADRVRLAKKAATEEERKEIAKGLRFESDRALFEFGTDFMEISPEIQKVFEEFEQVSVRKEIRGLIRELKKPGAHTDATKVIELLHDVRTTISKRTEEDDMIQFKKLSKELRESTGDLGKFQAALEKMNSFTTKKERDFIGMD